MRTLTALCAILISATTLAETIPLWKFFEPFDMQEVTISPKGTYLAASLLDGDGAKQKSKFQILDRTTGKRVHSFAMPDKRRIAGIRWLDDGSVLVMPSRKVANEDYYFPIPQLMTVIVKTGKTIDLPPLPSTGIFQTLTEEPGHALITKREGRYDELFKLHLRSGSLIKIARAPAIAGAFVLTHDRQGVAFHVGVNDEDEIVVHERASRGKWELISVVKNSDEGWLPMRAAHDPDEFFTVDRRNAKGIAALGIYNRRTGEHTEVFRDEIYDSIATVADQTGHVWGLTFDHHFPRVVYLDEEHPLAHAHKMIKRQYPESSVNLVSYSYDHKLVVAEVSHASALPEFVLLDTERLRIDQITNRAEEIGISSDQLATVEPFGFDAGDGTPIFGYLTSRKDTPRPGPTVVYVHGGPFGVRDSWRFEPVAQLFATHGYHVIQVNFRGSGGFGAEFQQKGYRQYGGKMQDDVTEATRFMVQAGIADQNRICITGGSYGAYSAVMGAAKEPDLYQCLIGVSGLYDVTAIERMGDLSRGKANVAYMRQTMGRTLEEREAISAINFADKVKAAVMLVHGGRDRRTPPEHYHRMKDAFENAGKEVVTHYRANQGHRWIGRDTLMDLYDRQIAFLEQHIGEGSGNVEDISVAN